ncbi:penicillin-binding protein activator [Algicella marina]|nr:penicillin-binding protein activator [Algicella marina]
MQKRNFVRLIAAVAGLAALSACTGPIAPQQGNAAPSGPVTVALLVPTGSADANQDQLGQSLVNAAELANRDLASLEITLKTYGTAGDQTTAASAANQAIAEGADIILGPLFGDTTTAVAPIAGAKALKILSFSNNPEIAGGNTYILGQTFENTARRVTSFAAGRGLNRLAIVHPSGLEGETARDAIRTAAAAAGSTIVTEGSYELSVEGITEAASGIATGIRGSGANAVMLTDGPTAGLPYITESLRGLGVRPAAAKFIGLQRWDISREAIGQPGLQGGWFAAPDPALLTAFEARYSAAYGTPPHPLSALAYDGMAAIGALLAEARAEGKGDPFSTDRLTKSAGFAGVNGVFRFLPDGRNERALAIIEVSLGDARPIDPAPRSFAPADGS